MWATLIRVSCAYIYFGAVLAGECLINCDTIESHNTPRGSGIDQDAGPSLWLGDLDDGVVSTAVYIQGCFATGGTIQGVAYGMMSFHGGLQWVAYTSDIAISSWCSTERQGDTSESVVFHFLLLGVWDRCLFVCVWLLCFACFVFWFPQTPCFPFHLFSNKWE